MNVEANVFYKKKIFTFHTQFYWVSSREFVSWNPQDCFFFSVAAVQMSTDWVVFGFYKLWLFYKLLPLFTPCYSLLVPQDKVICYLNGPNSILIGNLEQVKSRLLGETLQPVVAFQYEFWLIVMFCKTLSCNAVGPFMRPHSTFPLCSEFSDGHVTNVYKVPFRPGWPIKASHFRRFNKR